MNLYLFIIQNKEIFKLIYAFVIVLISVLIVLKTHKMYRLSLHPGIRYFRNAFFFYGIAFFVRYFLIYALTNYQIITPIFEFFIIMGGFFLLYSLLWRRFEGEKGHNSSLFNPKTLILYTFTIIIVVLNIIWKTLYLMFYSQILLFFIASIISFYNYRKNKGRHKFTLFYFIAMVLMFFAWIINSLVSTVFNSSPAALINIYIFNALFFLLFLYGVVRLTKR